MKSAEEYERLDAEREGRNETEETIGDKLDKLYKIQIAKNAELNSEIEKLREEVKKYRKTLYELRAAIREGRAAMS
jgi:predicted  nucleic acid-binding Zn-ribbon protein